MNVKVVASYKKKKKGRPPKQKADKYKCPKCGHEINTYVHIKKAICTRCGVNLKLV